METMKNFILMGMVLLPSMVIAATDCRVMEYPDHYYAVCVGDEKSETVAAQADKATQAPAPVAAQTPAVAQAPAVAAPAQAPSVQVKMPVTTQTDAAKTPFVIGQRRPDKSVRDAARASRARLILEGRQKQLDNPPGVN